jgi:hypothetical protein
LADIDLQHCQVEHRRCRDQPRWCTIAITEDRRQVGCVIHNMLVRDDDAGWINDESRPIDLHAARRPTSLGRRVHLPGGDVHHRWHRLPRD